MGRRCGRSGQAARAGLWVRAAGLAAGLALLSGCGPGGLFAPSPPPGKPMVLRPAPRPAPARPVPIRPPVPEPPAPADAATVPGATPAPGEAGPPPPAAVPSLAGLAAERVVALLGTPASRTASGAGERWRYVGPGCTLDLFLFPGIGRGGLAVLDRRASGTDEGECLRRIRQGGA